MKDTITVDFTKVFFIFAYNLQYFLKVKITILLDLLIDWWGIDRRSNLNKK